MNIEFHYYAIHYLCVASGYAPDQALAVAISSQMVDECTAPWRVYGSGDPDGLVGAGSGGPGGSSARDSDSARGGDSGGGDLLTEVTQNYLFWDENIRRDVYFPFHFVPGDPAAAADARAYGEAGRHTVTPDSPMARDMLIAALRTENVYRIGIALHPYADAWAHQNFSGDTEAANAFDNDSILPAVGHLQALSRPDDPQARWTDPRLKPEIAKIDNAERFLAAARMIYRFLSTSMGRSFADESFVLDKLERIWKNRNRVRDQSLRSFDYIVDLDVPPYVRGAWARAAGASMPGRALKSGGAAKPDRDSALFSGYDKVAWLAAAAARGRDDSVKPVRGSIPVSGWIGSKFERWNDAVRAHRGECRRLLEMRGF